MSKRLMTHNTTATPMTDDKRERLAALEHDQWAHWTGHMLDVLEPLLAYGRGGIMELKAQGFTDSDVETSLKALQRWKRQINTPYADLSEKEKDSDREWADKVLEITGTASPLDGAYSERAQCVAALVRLALGKGLPAGIVSATPDEWACAYIDTPEGQVAWHVAETDLRHFDGIPPFIGDTSQHYTTDEKYRRLALWAGGRNLDGDIIRVVQSIFSFAHFVVETPAEATLVRLMAKRGNPIDIDGSVRPIEEDYRRYLKDKEADWKEDQKSLAKEVEQWGKEDLAQHEITQFLRYLQACGGHDGPFDLKAHLPRIQRLLDAHDKVIEVRTLIKTQEGPPLIWSGTWRGTRDTQWTAIQFRYRWGSWSISTGGASVFAKDREFLYGGKGTRDGVETSTHDATCTWDEFVGWARDAGVTIRVLGSGLGECDV